MNRIHRGFPPFPHKTRKGWGTHFRGRERVGVPPELAKSSGRTGGSAEPMGWYRGFPPFPHKTRKGWGTHFKDRERVGVPPELAKSSGGTGGSAEPMGWYRGFPPFPHKTRKGWGTHLQWLYSLLPTPGPPARRAAGRLSYLASAAIPACSARVAALSVASQVKSGSLRPKWP